MEQKISSPIAVRRLLRINGIVQGVGFRPYVHRLAGELRLRGWVRNTTCGVELALQGTEQHIDQFVTRLPLEAPPLAHILSIDSWPTPTQLDEPADLVIVPSLPQEKTAESTDRTLIAPDVAVCPDCLRECNDPADRRYQYPFTNCTHCGPRFTIIEALPYDRPLTTMTDFPLCPSCKEEFGDSHNRRFHAQATTCPACGPSLWFIPSHHNQPQSSSQRGNENEIGQAVDYLKNGRIVAIKGLGGFHLACLAGSETAVSRLRQVKGRPHKPLALMVRDIKMAREIFQVESTAEALLTAPEAPIVLLKRLKEMKAGTVSPLIAPGNSAVGVMLPYTTLHHLLLQRIGAPLVMTSGNRTGEPLCISNEEAWEQLRPMCDGFLFHNRPITRRCDDSVLFVADLSGSETVQQVRRSRGFVPVPIVLPASLELPKPLLAMGGDLKNVSAVVAGRYVFMTQHIGDLERFNIQEEQSQTLVDFEDLFNIQPQTIVCDLHPDYAGSRQARERAAHDKLELIEVQHHHAHIAGCLAENNQSGPAIGLAFDGTGYGSDGRIWGGEVLLAGLSDFERAYHLEYLPLPGGDSAVKRPYRIAIAYLLAADPHLNISALFPHIPDHEIRLIEQMLTQDLNTPLTSSMGRLFDAVSALLGLCQESTHEAQAAMALEAAAWDSQANGRYYFCLSDGQIKVGRLLAQIVADHLRGSPATAIARRFHNTIAALALASAEAVRQAVDRPLPVALSGGVWQNRLLLELTVPQLEASGFEVLLHHKVPANDGGLAYGQTAIAAARLKETVCA